MKKSILIAAASLLTLGLQAQSTFNGNANSAWGGAVGNGSLTVSDSGANITLTAAGNDIATLTAQVLKADGTTIAGSTTNDTTTGAPGTIRYTDANGFVVADVKTAASTVLTGDSTTWPALSDSA